MHFTDMQVFVIGLDGDALSVDANHLATQIDEFTIDHLDRVARHQIVTGGGNARCGHCSNTYTDSLLPITVSCTLTLGL